MKAEYTHINVLSVSTPCDDIVLSSHELPNPYAVCTRAPFSPGHVICLSILTYLIYIFDVLQHGPLNPSFSKRLVWLQ